MADNWSRERAEPVAVGPPRRRMTRAERIREARGQRKRRMGRAFVLAALIVVLVGTVFLGSKLWHTLFSSGGNDYAGGGVNDVVIQVHDGDSHAHGPGEGPAAYLVDARQVPRSARQEALLVVKGGCNGHG